jgi:hypothetical protein
LGLFGLFGLLGLWDGIRDRVEKSVIPTFGGLVLPEASDEASGCPKCPKCLWLPQASGGPKCPKDSTQTKPQTAKIGDSGHFDGLNKQNYLPYWLFGLILAILDTFLIKSY